MADLVTVTLPSGTRVSCDKELAERLGGKQDNPAPAKRSVKKTDEK